MRVKKNIEVMNDLSTITFGPVPSRRLGRSLGINNIPPKVCSYSCLYCQVGRTLRLAVEPREFYRPDEIRHQVSERIKAVRKRDEVIDYLTFVPDGEPTLDINLGEVIDILRPLGMKIAVISNASLLWRQEVRLALHKADWVSVKVDAVDEHFWRRINRPHSQLIIDRILDGIRLFATEYSGVLNTETMLVQGLNDNRESMTGVRDFIASIHPSKAYLAVPTRPTAEKNIHPPTEETIVSAYHLFKKKTINVEYLIEYEGDDFSAGGNITDDLINITAVHPLREEVVKGLLQKSGEDWKVIENLVAEKKLTVTSYRGRRFYMRRLARQ